jgi:cob(I)alamin adenosyltransferase
MIHIYTGDGKGKTTAATGLAVRALGAGLSSIIIRFIKEIESSEDAPIKELGIPVEYFGTGFILDEIPKEAIALARKGLERTKEIIDKKLFDILILDEVNIAVEVGLISEQDILQILKMVPDDMEIILTGRGATDKMIEKANLVTDMKEVKHYYREGVKARKGIEY